MKIGFVFTNFNNSHYTREAIESIILNELYSEAIIVIVDNDSEKTEIDLLKGIKVDFPDIHLILNKVNSGYFNGLNVGLNYLRKNKTNIEYVVIGNNDLLFPKDFIASIKKNKELFLDYAVISPNIITLDGKHQNPHLISGLSKFREFIIHLHFSNYYLGIIIKKMAELTFSFTDRKDEKQFEIAQTLNQGYGACYILGPLFFTHFESLWAPTFLMEEEFFLSEQLRKKHLSVYYEPTITLIHQLHATTNKVPSKKMWKIARDAHRIYRKYLRTGSL